MVHNDENKSITSLSNTWKEIRFIDLFAGVGWFHLALSSLGGKCVYACEIDKNARITYKLNYKLEDNIFSTDIKEVSPETVPDHDILCAWFPCQAFSIAGYQKWFNDDRWNLFFDIARIVEKKKPRVLFLENVKNLASHDNGKTFRVILDTLKQLWYHVKWKVLNTYEYGNTPQNRERVYIVAFLEEASFNSFQFPEKIKLEKDISSILEKNVGKEFSYEWKPMYEKLKDEMTNKNTVYQWRRHYVRENKKWLVPTLTANMGTGGHNVPLLLTDETIRKMTPRECFLAQGYPADFQLPPLANSHLYKQAGNSVSVPVLKRIAEAIIASM